MQVASLPLAQTRCEESVGPRKGDKAQAVLAMISAKLRPNKIRLYGVLREFFKTKYTIMEDPKILIQLEKIVREDRIRSCESVKLEISESGIVVTLSVMAEYQVPLVPEEATAVGNDKGS